VDEDFGWLDRARGGSVQEEAGPSTVVSCTPQRSIQLSAASLQLSVALPLLLACFKSSPEIAHTVCAGALDPAGSDALSFNARPLRANS